VNAALLRPCQTELTRRHQACGTRLNAGPASPAFDSQQAWWALLLGAPCLVGATAPSGYLGWGRPPERSAGVGTLRSAWAWPRRPGPAAGHRATPSRFHSPVGAHPRSMAAFLRVVGVGICLLWGKRLQLNAPVSLL